MHTLQEKPPIVVGTDNYLKLTKAQVFVDKSLFIQALLADVSEALLITRPRRWGKSLNMSMLYQFLRCEVKKNPTTGELQTINPNADLFDNLRIGLYKELVANNQGQWPVIFLTLKEISGNNIEEIAEGFKDVLAQLYDQHSYLQGWLVSQKEEASLAKADYFSKIIKNQVKLTGLKKSLRFLSELLYQYHGRKVFVLIDEYDAPLNNTFLKPELYQEVLTFLRGFLGNCFKGNPYLEKGILTGIFRVAKAELFSSLNNFSEYSLLDEEYAEHFGFTDSEIQALFNHPIVKQRIEKHQPSLQLIQRLYDGYWIGGITIYNPWSIMNCIQHYGKLGAYWVNTGSDLMLRDLLKDNLMLLQQIEELLTHNTRRVTISPHINMLNMNAEVKFWSLMLSAGYLTLTQDMPIPSDIEVLCQVTIPNAEVRRAHEYLLVNWFRGEVGNDYSNLVSKLFNQDIGQFVKALNAYLQESTSLRNVGPYRAELFYQGFMVGLLAVIRKEYLINTELESGKGYVDTILIPRETNQAVGLVLEYKVAEKPEELAAKLEEAFDQIETKDYLSKMKQYPHIQQVAKVGIAFCGKEAVVKRETVTVAS